jgi:hypothetical protein
MTLMLKFLLSRWQFIALGLAAVATFALIFHIRSTLSEAQAEAAAARKAEEEARTAAEIERTNASRLEALLAEARANAEAERQARQRAAQQRDEARAADQAADAQLGETIVVERQTDVTLDQCLGYELPASVLRQLP